MPIAIETKPSTAPDGSASQATAAQKKQWLKTVGFWAMGAFVALNCAFAYFSPDSKPQPKVGDKSAGTESVKDLWSGTGSIDLAINGLAALKERPTVVLLGSSLMMHPFWTMDIEVNRKIPDIFHYHGSVTLERELAKDGVPGQRVYSLAIFGQMVSDAYIYVNDFLKGSKTPDVLVYGIAPRDFSDSDLPAPMATFTFKRLVGLDNFQRYADAYLPGWQDKTDFLATHSCFLYGKRWRLQHEVEKAVDKGYSKMGVAMQDAATTINVNKGEESDEKNAGFMLAGSLKDRWKTSEREYRRRYHDIENKNLAVQTSFLTRLLNVCHDRHIKLVLVNMPLSEKNRGILPPGFYDSFRNQVKALATRPDVDFIDLGEAPGFTDYDFWDTAHLNNYGGHKLVAQIAPHIAKELKAKN